MLDVLLFFPPFVLYAHWTQCNAVCVPAADPIECIWLIILIRSDYGYRYTYTCGYMVLACLVFFLMRKLMRRSFCGWAVYACDACFNVGVLFKASRKLRHFVKCERMVGRALPRMHHSANESEYIFYYARGIYVYMYTRAARKGLGWIRGIAYSDSSRQTFFVFLENVYI